jgi:hypothetical protein
MHLEVRRSQAEFLSTTILLRHHPSRLTSFPSYFVLLPLPSLTLPCLEHDRPAQTQSPSRLRAPPPSSTDSTQRSPPLPTSPDPSPWLPSHPQRSQPILSLCNLRRTQSPKSPSVRHPKSSRSGLGTTRSVKRACEKT